MKSHILIIGAGGMARAMALDLRRREPSHKIVVLDRDPAALKSLGDFVGLDGVELVTGDASDPNILCNLLKNASAAIGAASYNLHLLASEIAIDNGSHWVDLGGNPTVVQNQFLMHEKAVAKGVSIVPDSGLAPGLINIVGGAIASKLDSIDELHFRVGGLPQNPKPPLFYGLVFSPEGLANEYHEPAWVVEEGELKTVESLTGWERVYFGAPFGTLEAFHTAGGSSTMTETFKGKVKTLDYKTLRYPGHLRRIKLLGDIGFWRDDELKIDGISTTPRKALGAMLMRQGFVTDDLVVLLGWGTGKNNGKSIRVDIKMIDYADASTGLTAMARTTGFPAVIIARMLAEGSITKRGALKQELEIPHEVMFKELQSRGVKIEMTERDL